MLCEKSVSLCGVLALARVLLKTPQQERRVLCQQILLEAQAAETYRTSKGKAHPDFGDGSFLSAAMHHIPSKEPANLTDAYSQCIRMVLQMLDGRDTSMKEFANNSAPPVG